MQANAEIDNDLSTQHFAMSDLAMLARRFRSVDNLPTEIAYEFSKDPALLHRYYHLREEMFISTWGLQSPQGQKDVFDDRGEILIARLGKLCIGGGRLTISTPNAPTSLPMEKAGIKLQAMFAALDLQDTTYGELSRMAVDPDYRDEALPEMMNRLVKRMIAEGAAYMFNLSPVSQARNLRKALGSTGFGVDMKCTVDTPEGANYEGTKMVLSVLDLSKYKTTPNAAKRSKTEVTQALSEA
jgi:hypothetical protein